MTDPAAAIWPAVDRLVDSAPFPETLRTHRVHLLAARHWRAVGRPVSEELQEEERTAALSVLTAPLLLERVVAACGEPVILLKGPEVGAFYPDPALRPFHDLDLLVADAPRAQKALIRHGFVPIGNSELYVDIHHERPLASPGLLLHVELHRVPKWPEWTAPPSVDDLFRVAVPSTTRVDGVLGLPPEHTALVLAAHSWAHQPLRRLIELIDVAAVAAHCDPDAVDGLARRYELDRVWRTTRAAAGALFTDDSRKTLALRLWARDLPDVRERTVLETHLEHWLSPFWALPAGRALAKMREELAREIRPAPGETAGVKLRRTGLAIRNAFVGRSRHEAEAESKGVLTRRPPLSPRPEDGSDD